MKRWWVLAASAGVLCVLLGCVPRKLFWSPDGRHGAVVTEKGLYLCDPQGKLSKLIAPDVQLVAWFPDSKGFIAAQTDPVGVGTWEEIQSLLSEQRQSELIALADQLRAEALAYQGNWDEFKPTFKDRLTGGELAALVLYVRDHRNQGLPEKLGDQWAKLKELKLYPPRLQVYELTDDGAKPGRIIHALLDAFLDIRISPDGRVVAVTVPMPSDTNYAFPLGRLLLFSTQANSLPVTVADNVSAYSDWSPDGKFLYYGTTKTPPTEDQGAPALGSLTRRRVVEEAGAFISELPKPEDLVGLMFWSQMKVRCLADGRVLFSSCEVTLPATTAEMPQQVGLFIIDPARQPTVSRILPRAAAADLEGLSLGEFELSPDAQKLVATDASKGVSVLTLATGHVDVLIPSEGGSDLPSVPVWRTADELAIAVPANSPRGAPDRPELVLWSLKDGKARCISREWPDTFEQRHPAIKSPPESQPASQAPGGLN